MNPFPLQLRLVKAQGNPEDSPYIQELKKLIRGNKLHAAIQKHEGTKAAAAIAAIALASDKRTYNPNNLLDLLHSTVSSERPVLRSVCEDIVKAAQDTEGFSRNSRASSKVTKDIMAALRFEHKSPVYIQHLFNFLLRSHLGPIPPQLLGGGLRITHGTKPFFTLADYARADDESGRSGMDMITNSNPLGQRYQMQRILRSITKDHDAGQKLLLDSLNGKRFSAHPSLSDAKRSFTNDYSGTIGPDHPDYDPSRLPVLPGPDHWDTFSKPPAGYDKPVVERTLTPQEKMKFTSDAEHPYQPVDSHEPDDEDWPANPSMLRNSLRDSRPFPLAMWPNERMSK